ncbi:hypothetical protein ABZT03_43995 [Streptomyces sp. NPDC005574]|uniref:hypothetical protein n=1 Tax=Streptomyces sp. NPDC005574 TaxID=3156891 RepID=UPI0033B69850
MSCIDEKTSEVVIDGFRGQPLAPSVRAFYHQVGSVNLTGYSHRWPPPIPVSAQYGAPYFLGDGLFVHSVNELLLAAEEIPAGSSNLGFSPDIFHKEDISGGPPYSFDVVSPSLDAFCTTIGTTAPA